MYKIICIKNYRKRICDTVTFIDYYRIYTVCYVTAFQYKFYLCTVAVVYLFSSFFSRSSCSMYEDRLHNALLQYDNELTYCMFDENCFELVVFYNAIFAQMTWPITYIFSARFIFQFHTVRNRYVVFS